MKLVSIPFCHKLFKCANFNAGPLSLHISETSAGICLRRIHSNVLQGCLHHPLEPRMQLLEAGISMVPVTRVPQIERSFAQFSEHYKKTRFLKGFYRITARISNYYCISCCITRFSRRVLSLLASTQRCSSTP